MADIKLTDMSKGSGCGCKINPVALKELLQGFEVGSELQGLVRGNSMADDCSVYDLGNGTFLLQTVDFFTPIVNDAYTFGAAAAANALSDIWAMGGKVLMANAVFSWPLDVLPIAMGREVLRGANELCKKHGIPVAGGHSIDGKEPLFGLSVTGICGAGEMKANSGAQPGDIILLTKRLGLGMLAAAHKREQATPEQNAALFHYLTQTNAVGEVLGKISGVHAMTDVTGFGLGGHLLELCRASSVSATIRFEALLPIPEAESLAASFVLPDNAMRNWNAYEKHIQLNNQAAFPWISDPQTNGGLLIAVHPDALSEVENALQKEGTEYSIIGSFESGEQGIMVD